LTQIILANFCQILWSQFISTTECALVRSADKKNSGKSSQAVSRTFACKSWWDQVDRMVNNCL